MQLALPGWSGESRDARDLDESPPPSPPQRRYGPRGPYMRRAEVDAVRHPLREDAWAGVPHILLARRAGVTREQVRQWRRREGIRGVHGARPIAAQLDYTLRPRTGTASLLHVAASSVVGGTWEPPSYVLRTPIHYDRFVEVVALAIEQFTTSEISAALGVRERDVLDAVRLHDARRAAP
jgi:hypothetical protein